MRPLMTVGDTSATVGMGTNMNTNEAYRILLIERDAAETDATRTALAETKGRAFSVEWVRDLSAGPMLSLSLGKGCANTTGSMAKTLSSRLATPRRAFSDSTRSRPSSSGCRSTCS